MTGDAYPPGRPGVSDQQQSQRREEIIAAAKKVFARNRFHATTIADVAKEAQLPFGSVYQYFDSKDALFQALIAAEGYSLRTHVAIALAESGSIRLQRGAVSRHVAGDVRVLRRRQGEHEIAVPGRFPARKAIRHPLGGIYERWIDDIESLIIAAQKRGDVVAAPSRLVAFTVTALIGESRSGA